MKTLLKSLLFAVGLLLCSGFADAQTILTNTTLSAAVTTPTPGNPASRFVVVASATNINAPSSTDNTKLTYLWVDRELMEVESVNGTTITVARGMGGTTAAPHVNAANVFVIPASKATFFGVIPQGSCTRANELLLPRIHYATGIISDCLGGQWVQGDASQITRTVNNLYRFPDPGGTALTALETAGTAAGAATEIYCTEVDIPYSMMLTGAAVLNGTTVGTNKHFIILYDSGGNVLANSATAGTTTSGASTYQKLNFTSKYYAVGPARYFVCDGLNGTTDTIRHAVTATNDNVLGGTITGQTFGTAAAITVPSSFTTAKVPYVAVF